MYVPSRLFFDGYRKSKEEAYLALLVGQGVLALLVVPGVRKKTLLPSPCLLSRQCLPSDPSLHEALQGTDLNYKNREERVKDIHKESILYGCCLYGCWVETLTGVTWWTGLSLRTRKTCGIVRNQNREASWEMISRWLASLACALAYVVA